MNVHSKVQPHKNVRRVLLVQTNDPSALRPESYYDGGQNPGVCVFIYIAAYKFPSEMFFCAVWQAISSDTSTFSFQNAAY